ncbi:MAG TPA: PAS domain S-box protein [Puia sp.]|nr:PAS domain S-box protein [Puia sp.]
MNSYQTTESIAGHGFLSGGGEMGQRIREFDWESTSAGPPGCWPQSLRTTISTILHSRFPMFLWWGPDLLCFYNDAYRPNLGQNGKHPSILGQKAAIAWAEVWDVIKPLIDQVLTKGESTWNEDQLIPIYRNGRIEDAYWTFSYSPVNDEAGKPAGVLVICNETTEKVIQYRQLKESESMFRSLADSSPVMIWVLEADGKLSFLNHTWFEYTGQELQQALTQAWMEVIHPEDYQAIYDAYVAGMTKKTPYSVEIRIKDKAGDYRWFLTNGVPRYLPNGDFDGFLGTVTDIDDIKRAEKENRKLVAILESSQEFVGMAGLDTYVEYINPAGLKLLGWDRFEGRQIMDCVYPADRECAMELLPKIIEKGFFQQEIRFWNERTGVPFWIQWNGMTIVDSHTGEITSLATISPNITERKEAEQALTESEERFRTLAETLPQLVWMTDEKGSQLYASSRWKEYTGIEPTGIETWQQIIHPKDLEHIGRKWMNSLDKGVLYRAEVRLKDRSGSYRWHSVQGEPIRNEKGEVIKWIGSFTDIHTQKESEQQLEALVVQRTADLARSNEDLEQFAHVASHDLKEPVRKIKLFSNRLQEEMNDTLPERGKIYLDKIQRAAGRMIKMIEGVLAYSSNDHSTELIEKVNLQEIVRDIITDLDMLIQEKRARIYYQELPTFEGATVLIYQLFYNLLNNSLKFLRTDILPEIHITSERVSMEEKEYFKIRIRDNGIGFKQEYAQKIFESFARLHSKDKYEGTGLGLALCKKIIQRHHGTISASGELNKGATFEVLLPVIQENRSV